MANVGLIIAIVGGLVTIYAMLNHVVKSSELRLTDEIRKIRMEIKADMQSDTAILNANMGSLRTEMKADMNSHTAALNANMNSLRTEMKADMNSHTAALNANMNSLRTEMKAGFKSLGSRVRDIERNVLGQNRQLELMTRLYTAGMHETLGRGSGRPAVVQE